MYINQNQVNTVCVIKYIRDKWKLVAICSFHRYPTKAWDTFFISYISDTKLKQLMNRFKKVDLRNS